MKKLYLVLLAMALVVSCGFSTASAKTYELKIQTSLATSSMYFKTLERLKKNIEELSQGQIKVELYADGAIVKNFEIFDAVSEGLVNGGMCWTHWASGKHPAGTPGGARKVSLLIWVWDVYFSWNQPKHSGPMGNTGQDIMSSFRMS